MAVKRKGREYDAFTINAFAFCRSLFFSFPGFYVEKSLFFKIIFIVFILYIIII